MKNIGAAWKVIDGSTVSIFCHDFWVYIPGSELSGSSYDLTIYDSTDTERHVELSPLLGHDILMLESNLPYDCIAQELVVTIGHPTGNFPENVVSHCYLRDGTYIDLPCVCQASDAEVIYTIDLSSLHNAGTFVSISKIPVSIILD